MFCKLLSTKHQYFIEESLGDFSFRSVKIFVPHTHGLGVCVGSENFDFHFDFFCTRLVTMTFA